MCSDPCGSQPFSRKGTHKSRAYGDVRSDEKREGGERATCATRPDTVVKKYVRNYSCCIAIRSERGGSLRWLAYHLELLRSHHGWIRIQPTISFLNSHDQSFWG